MQRGVRWGVVGEVKHVWMGQFAWVCVMGVMALGPAARGEEEAAPGGAGALRAVAVLKENCQSCHNAEKKKGGLVLMDREGLLRGGDGGAVVEPGNAGRSKLLEVLGAGADPHMPPKGQLTAGEIEVLRQWVDTGVVWPKEMSAAATRPTTRPIELKALPEGYEPVLAMALSADGKRLAVGRGDRIFVFDTEKEGKVVAEHRTPHELVYALAWDPQGKVLASGGYRKLRLWGASAEPVVLTGCNGRVTSICFTPDGSALVAAEGEPASEGMVRQWKMPEGTPVNDWMAHKDSILAVKLTLDGARVITGGADKLVKVWERATGKELGVMEGHSGPVMALAVNVEGTHVASGGGDREVKVWDLKTREQTVALTSTPGTVSDLCWVDERRILSASQDGLLRLTYKDEKERARQVFRGAGDAIHCLAKSPDGKTVYAGSHDGRVHAWSIADNKPVGANLVFGPLPNGEETVREEGEHKVRPYSFVNDVLPVMSRLGCNAGACHAKPAGQSGFKLSVFAYDPKADHSAIVKDGRARRVFASGVQESLLLLKPTMSVEHGGGLRLKKDSEAYKLLVKWIEQGMPYSPPGDATLVAIEVEPKEGSYAKQSKQVLKVKAKYSDGSQRDVTHLADLSSTEKEIARVSEDAVVRVGETSGEAVIVARYMGLVDVSRVTVPAEKVLAESYYAALPVNNYVDRHLYARLAKLALTPSELCSDEEFIRRASLDAIGVLPSVEQVKGFLADQDPQKRNKLIEKLLDDPRYADHWAIKWADLLRPNPFRVGIKSVYMIDQWLRESFRQNKPYDQFARELVTASGSTHKYGPVVLFRDRREPADITTLVSQVFLGVRLECARCHHHPNEKWSQEDFYQFAAYFGQLKRKGQGISAPISGEPEYIWFAPGGDVKHPVSEQVMKPKAPDAPSETIEAQRDPREALAAWMTRPDNPFFAKAAVNRVWGELMGRGLVHPVDDFRISNPATNDPLLAALARDFVEHGYDLKHVMRTIMRSRAYQLSSVPVAGNVKDTKNHSRWYRRRPSAEVLLDAVCDVTGVPENLPGVGPGVRAVAAWNYRIDSEFLDAFSRPNASSDPPCERENQSSLVQALHLMNSNRLMAKIRSDEGRAAKLAGSKMTGEEIVTELYLVCYARRPTAEEMGIAAKAFTQEGATRRTATEDILWALMNTAEFVLNH